MAQADEGGGDVLDLQGLKCPLPAMKTRNALLRLSPGAALRVLATDPLSAIDVPHAVALAGGRVTAISREGAVLTFDIVRSGGAGKEFGS